MKQPEPGSPFVGIGDEDARPSAGEYLRRQAERDRRAARTRWALFAVMLAGASLAASGAAAVGVGAGVFLPALMWSVALGAGGAVAGAFVGMCSWAGLVSRARSPGPFKQPLIEGNNWDALTVWLAAWSAMGVALGAGMGATQGALDAIPGSRPEYWAYLGASIGLLAGAGTFLAASARAQPVARKGPPPAQELRR
jgi:hypothetical protein